MITREELKNKIAKCEKEKATVIRDKQAWIDKCDEKIENSNNWINFYQEALDGKDAVYDEN